MGEKKAFSNRTKNFYFTSFLFLSFCIKYSDEAFLSYQIITDGLSAPNEPNYPFYNDNLLHLIVGVKGGNIGLEASLVQYNSGGTISKNITFPLPCDEEDCSLEGAVFGLVNNTAYISIRRFFEYKSIYSCMIYQINLISFQIINSSDIFNGTNSYSNYCSYSLPFWTPYNSTHSLFENGQWFEYETLSLLELVPIFPYNNLGGATPAMAENNLVFYQDLDGYNEIFITQNVETFKYEEIDLNGAYMMVFLGDNSTNVAITNQIYNGFNLTLLDVVSNFRKIQHPPSIELIMGYPQTGFFGDSSNNIFFIGVSLGDDKGILFSQYKVDVSNNSHTIYDIMTINNYLTNTQYYSPNFSVLSWGLNEPSQQFAIVAEDVNTKTFALLVINYDNSLSPD